MPPKKAARKSRMDLLLENMGTMDRAAAPMTAAEFLAQGEPAAERSSVPSSASSSISSDDDDDLCLSAMTSPSGNLAPQAPQRGRRAPNLSAAVRLQQQQQRGRRLERDASFGSDGIGGGESSSPLFLSELALRQRRRDMEAEGILFEAEAVGCSKGGAALCALVKALCGTNGGDADAEAGADEDRCAEADDAFGLDAFLGGASAAAPAATSFNSECGAYAAEAAKSLATLRSMGQAMASLVAALTDRPFYGRADATSSTIAKAHLCFARFVFSHCAVETYVKHTVIRFVVDVLLAQYPSSPSFAPTSYSSPTAASPFVTPDTASAPETKAASPVVAKKGAGSHWAVLLGGGVGGAANSKGTCDGPQSPATRNAAALGGATDSTSIASAAEDERTLRAVRCVLGSAEFGKVKAPLVTVADIACDLLAFLLVSSNRHSLFGGGDGNASPSFDGGIGLESQASDLSDLFMGSPSSQNAGASGSSYDADDAVGQPFGAKRQRSTAADDAQQTAASGGSASMAFHNLGGFAACESALSIFVEQRGRKKSANSAIASAKSSPAAGSAGSSVSTPSAAHLSPLPPDASSSSPSPLVSIASIAKVLSLLEVATCNDALKASPRVVQRVLGALLKRLFDVWALAEADAAEREANQLQRAMGATLTNQIVNQDDEEDPFASCGDLSCIASLRPIVLRVLTNISGVCHGAVPTDPAGAARCAEQIAAALAKYTTPMTISTVSNAGDAAFSSSVCDSAAPFAFEAIAEVIDEVCELVCLAINMCCRGTHDIFRWALLNARSIHPAVGRTADKAADAGTSPFAEWCAGWLQTLYNVDEEVSANVLGGYVALLLAMLSLGDEAARVRVVAALATNAAPSVRPVASKPLTWVVAVLQEFVLFQSAAQILTREMVVAMHAVIDGVISENGIVVSPTTATAA